MDELIKIRKYYICTVIILSQIVINSFKQRNDFKNHNQVKKHFNLDHHNIITAIIDHSNRN